MYLKHLNQSHMPWVLSRIFSLVWPRVLEWGPYTGRCQQTSSDWWNELECLCVLAFYPFFLSPCRWPQPSRRGWWRREAWCWATSPTGGRSTSSARWWSTLKWAGRTWTSSWMRSTCWGGTCSCGFGPPEARVLSWGGLQSQGLWGHRGIAALLVGIGHMPHAGQQSQNAKQITFRTL